MKWKTFFQVSFLLFLLGGITFAVLWKIKPVDRYDFKESTFDFYAGDRSFQRKAIIKMDKATGRSWELAQGMSVAGRFASQWENIQEAEEPLRQD